MMLLKTDRGAFGMLVRLYKLSPADMIQVDGCSRPNQVRAGIPFMGIKDYDKGCYVVGLQLTVNDRVLHINSSKCSTYITYEAALAAYNLRLRPNH